MNSNAVTTTVMGFFFFLGCKKNRTKLSELREPRKRFPHRRGNVTPVSVHRETHMAHDATSNETRLETEILEPGINQWLIHLIANSRFLALLAQEMTWALEGLYQLTELLTTGFSQNEGRKVRAKM